MSKVFGLLINNRVHARVIYDSYESISEILAPDSFVEETEETGPLHFGGLWDGEKFTPPTEQEVKDFEIYLNSKSEEQITITK